MIRGGGGNFCVTISPLALSSFFDRVIVIFVFPVSAMLVLSDARLFSCGKAFRGFSSKFNQVGVILLFVFNEIQKPPLLAL